MRCLARQIPQFLAARFPSLFAAPFFCRCRHWLLIHSRGRSLQCFHPKKDFIENQRACFTFRYLLICSALQTPENVDRAPNIFRLRCKGWRLNMRKCAVVRHASRTTTPNSAVNESSLRWVSRGNERYDSMDYVSREPPSFTQ